MNEVKEEPEDADDSEPHFSVNELLQIELKDDAESSAPLDFAPAKSDTPVSVVNSNIASWEEC
jgi:hypothetical protein